MGTFYAAETDKEGRDFRGKGVLRYVGDFVAAVLHSLEVATFVDAAERPAASLVMRFLEEFQRIIVPVQLGLFLVAIKRDFERK